MKKYYDNDLLDEIAYSLKVGKIDKAINKISEYKMVYPNDLAADIYYCKVLVFLGKYEEAQLLAQSLVTNTFHSDNLLQEAWLVLGSIYKHQDMREEAISCYEKAKVHSNIRKTLAHINLSKIYSRMGRFSDAFKELNIKMDCEDSYLIELERARLLLEIKTPDKAIFVLKQIDDDIFSSKEHYQIKYQLLGDAYYDVNDRDNALINYKKSLTIKNNIYWKSYFNIAKIYFDFGKYDKSYDMVLDVQKNSKINVNHLLICNLLKRKKYDEIESLISKLNEIEQLYLRGILSFEMQDFGSAINYFNKLSTTNTFRKDYEFYLVISYVREKKYTEALGLINNIKENNYDGLLNKMIYDLRVLEYYTRVMLNENVAPQGYSEHQIYFYDYNLAISHILDRHGSDLSKICDIDIKKLFDYLKNNINKATKSISSCFDLYLFDYNDINKDLNSNIGQNIIIVCLCNTNNVITMYPSNKLEMGEDLEEMPSKPKTKRLTQVEKFNKKYNIK